ncbi:MAG: hypothetical protein Q9203_002933 [Teloschistes exilis]
MAWPWPDNHGADQCRSAYRRDTSCLESWRHDQQINAGLLLLVAIASFLTKLLVLILYRARTPLMQHGRHGYAALTNGGNDNENGIQQEERGGPQRRIETTYRDEPTEDAGTGTQDPGTDHVAAQGHSESMAVQPSSLQAHENEWRD